MKLFIAFLALGSACVAVSPPPIVTGHGLPIPDEEGTTTVTLMLATNFELKRPGLDIRVHKQVRPDLKVGASLGGGWNFQSGEWIQGLLSTRFLGMYNPRGEEIIGIPFGIGLGAATNGLIYATADTGVLVSSPGDIGAYVSPVVALSIPLRTGKPYMSQRLVFPGAQPLPDRGNENLLNINNNNNKVATYAKTTFWFGLLLGAQAMYGDDWTTSLEAGILIPDRGLGGVDLLSLAQSKGN